MGELDDIRKRIDAIDAKMALLFEERMLEVEQIAHFKALHGLQTLDTEREAQIWQRNSELIGNESIRGHYRDFIDGVLNISKAFQKETNEK